MENNQICAVCKTENASEARFCQTCGTALKQSVDVEFVTKKPKERTRAKYPVRILLRNLVLVLVSLLCLVFTILPAYTTEVDLYGEKITAKYSVYDTFIHFWASGHELDEEDLEDTNIYETFLEDCEELLEDADWDDDETEIELSKKERRLASKIAKNFRILTLLSEETEASASLIISFVAAIIFILILIATFIFALLNMILFFTKKGNTFRMATRFIALAAAMIPAVYMASISGYLTYGYANIKMSMGAGLIVSLILLLSVIIYIGIDRIIATKKLDSVGGIIKKSLSFALCLLLIIMIFQPVLGLEANVSLYGKTSEQEIHFNFTAADLGMFDVDCQDGMDSDDYDELKTVRSTIVDLTESWESFTSKEVKNGDTDAIAAEVLLLSTLGFGYVEMGIIPVFVPIISTVALISVGLLIWQILNWFALGKTNKAITLISKITTPIMAAMILGLVIATVAWGNYNLDDNKLNKIYELLINASVIFSFVLSVAVTCIPLKTKKRVYAEEASPEDNEI